MKLVLLLCDNHGVKGKAKKLTKYKTEAPLRQAYSYKCGIFLQQQNV